MTNRILVVEDEDDMQDLIAAILRADGYEPLLARNGADRLADVETLDYQMVITDVVMPGCDGIEIIRSARRRCPDVPVVAISGGGARMPATVGLRLSEAIGANRVLYKPFSRAELRAAVTDLLPVAAA